MTESPAHPGSTDPTVPHARVGGHGEPGAFIVLEGIDRSGRSTHARRLEAHLRYTGRGVTRTSLATSALAAEPIRRARLDRHADATEVAILYAADLAERIEQVVLPSLRAGLIVIADRYCWTPMARAEARGVDPAWLEALFSFVTPPDVVLLLDIDPGTALARRDDDPDPYEAGLDLGLSPDVRESYRLFGERLAGCFDRYAAAHGFTRIAATEPVDRIGTRLARTVDSVVAARARSRHRESA